MLIVIITSILIIFGSHMARTYWPELAIEYSLEEDGLVEESTEKSFEHTTGLDVDFSPKSKEKR